MVVVSNAGPLIALSKLGRLALLPALYDQVLIPLEEIKRRPEFWISEQLCDAALEQVRTGQRSTSGEE